MNTSTILAKAMNLYGLDWAAMICSLTALYLIGKKKPSGFLCFITANLCWVVVGWLTSSIAISGGNVLFLVLNARGYLGWIHPPVQPPAPQLTASHDLPFSSSANTPPIQTAW